MRARPGRQREHLPRPEQVEEPALLGPHVAVEIRRGRQEEAVKIADVWLCSRAASVPAVPSPVHSDEEVRGWFREVVLPTKDVWVAALNGTVAALLVLDGDWIDQLYVDPRCTGRGLGTRLVALAKLLQPRGLQLWTFQANRRARSFYERLGFTAMEATGGDNEEGAPDVRYEWRPAEPHRGS